MNSSLILKRLQELGVSDETFAAALQSMGVKCSIYTVRNMKRGRQVQLQTAVAAAEYLKVKLTDLVLARSGAARAPNRESA